MTSTCRVSLHINHSLRRTRSEDAHSDTHTHTHTHTHTLTHLHTHTHTHTLARTRLLIRIHIFPVWTASAGRASFVNLSAVGGFLVTASINISGIVDVPVFITSTRGQPCTVVSPWTGGVRVTIVATGAPVAVMASPDHQRFTFRTDSGQRYAVQAE